MIFRSHRSQAIAHASVGMTWLLNSAAAIDARHHTYPRRHDLAAGAIRTLMQYPPKQLMTIRGTLTVIRVKQITNDNSL